MSTEAGPLRMVVTLGVAGMLSGLCLVGAHMVTAPRIARNRAEALESAIYRVVPGAVSQRPYGLRDGKLVAVEPAAAHGGEELVYAGLDADGKRLGFAVPTEGGGFQDTIKLIYGIDPGTGKLLGMEVLESLETPGLGDKIVKDRAFVDAFEGLEVRPEIVAAKTGTASRPNEVDAISGATISSKAVVRIINEGNARWLDHLPAAGEASP